MKVSGGYGRRDGGRRRRKEAVRKRAILRLGGMSFLPFLTMNERVSEVFIPRALSTS